MAAMFDPTPREGDPRLAAAREMAALELRRRDALRLVFGAAAAAAMGVPQSAEAGLAAGPQFLHGVASGDPTQTNVIIWTRVTVEVPHNVAVHWSVSPNADMSNPVQFGNMVATGAADWTVKVDVGHLRAGHEYFYQFRIGMNGQQSTIGRAMTLPLSNSTAPIDLVIFSCTNYVKGYFHAYAEAAKLEKLNAMLHIGDYVYEYGPAAYRTTSLALGLVVEPRAAELAPMSETVLLDAYRTRKALYRSDADLQAAHARAPWVVIWDDHESANDTWTGGAENHHPATQGPWQPRKVAAVQAYYEWLPIREPADGNRIDPVTGNPAHMARSYDFGKLARLVLLDTRMAHRDQQLTPAQMLGVYQAAAKTGSYDLDRNADGSVRTMMGTAQELWVDQQLGTSTQTWQLIGNQILLHYQIAPDFVGTSLLNATQKAQVSGLIDAVFGPGAGPLFGQIGQIGGPNPGTYDSWNGYPSARARLYGSLSKAANPVILSGDSHNAWAADLKVPTAAGPVPLGVEFGGTSVTSPGYEETFPQIPAALLSALIVQSSAAKSPGDKLRYADTSRRGFMQLHVETSAITMTYVFVDSVFTPGPYTTTTQSFTVRPGAKALSQLA